MAVALADGVQPPQVARTPRDVGGPLDAPSHPMILLNRVYTCADGRYVLLIMPIRALMMPQYWPRFCAAVGREEWLPAKPCPSQREVEAIFLQVCVCVYVCVCVLVSERAPLHVHSYCQRDKARSM